MFKSKNRAEKKNHNDIAMETVIIVVHLHRCEESEGVKYSGPRCQ